VLLQLSAKVSLQLQRGRVPRRSHAVR